MSDLIVSVVVDVLSHVLVKDVQRGSVLSIASATWNFPVLDTGQFIVLDPKVGLEGFQRRREPEQCRVSGRESATRSCCSEPA